ncbi:homoserine O-acetyltransferase MetX [Serinibacter salmoneus]|nr:homoserine O-acetyltransferase [Serinibacter salmoneus]
MATPWQSPERRARIAPSALGQVRAAAGEPPPVTGAWREGDPVGHRRFHEVGDLELEAGGSLPGARLAYETWGTLNAAADNAILLLHGLTGDSHVLGAAGDGHLTPGWWEALVGPGRAIDTNRYFVVAPNVLGGCQGSTGPASIAPDGAAWGSRFPALTARDQVAAEASLATALGVTRWALVIGASMGGHRVLEWAAGYPERVGAIVPIATAAQTSGDQIAWAHAQIGAIRGDVAFRGGDYYEAPAGQGPHRGLALARQIGHATYRSARELDARFGRIPQRAENPLDGSGRFAVQSYLDHHGDKLARRFDAGSYVVLTQAMITHDLGRDRGGVEAALAGISARTLAIGIDTDRLFLAEQSARIARGVPGGELRVVRSDHGHDGFLIESDTLGPIISAFLGEVAPVVRRA